MSIITDYRLETNKDGSYTEKYSQIKHNKTLKGWFRVYKDWKLIYEQCNSNLDNKMANFIIEEVKIGFVLEVTPKELATKFKTGDRTAVRFMKKMKDIDFIRGRTAPYKTNPFMVLPQGMSDEAIYKAQQNWE